MLKSHLTVSLLGLWTLSVFGSLAEAEEKRSFLAADSSKGRIAIIAEDGSTQWEYKIGPLHDLSMLPSGNVLMQTSWTDIVEINPSDNEIVWQYDSRSPDQPNERLEIHAFERNLHDGTTMIAESGRSRIINVLDEQIVSEFALKVSKPDAHRDTRLVRRLENGDYLVCHEGDAIVRQYESTGKIVWEYAVPLFDRAPAGGHGIEAFGNQCFAALRLANGNTLISTGNGHSILEVDRQGAVQWKLDGSDLPGVELAWITTLQVLPSGNIAFGNCHAGEANPQIIEVSRAKEIVWTFKDFERFGNSLTNSQILTVNAQPCF